MIRVMSDKTHECRSGFKVDAKWVGNALDEIIEEDTLIDERLDEPCVKKLIELKNYLRFKGNSRREDGDLSLWG